MKLSKGSAVAVVSVVIVVAIIAALGWVLYSRYIVSDDTVQVTDDSTVTESTQNSGTICDDQEKLCFDVDGSWSDNVATYGNVLSVRTLSSTNGAASLYVTTGIDGLGGICSATDTATTVEVVETVETKAMVSTNDDSGDVALAAVKVILMNSDMTYTPLLMLSSDAKLSQIGTYNGCDVGYGDVIIQNNSADSDNTGATYDMTVGSFEGLMGVSSSLTAINATPDVPMVTEDQARALLESDEYKATFDVLATAHYE